MDSSAFNHSGIHSVLWVLIIGWVFSFVVSLGGLAFLLWWMMSHIRFV